MQTYATPTPSAQELISFVENYAGDFGFLISIRGSLAQYGSLTAGQLAAVARCYAREQRAILSSIVADAVAATSHAEVAAQLDGTPYSDLVDDIPPWESTPNLPYDLPTYDGPIPPVAPKPVAVTVVPNGYYTVVDDDGRRTFRVTPGWTPDHAARGTQILSYLSGPDNENAYCKFAFVEGSKLTVWRAHREKEVTISYARLFLRLSAGELELAGKAYAVESGNCRRCGRRLTTPESIAAGIGPVCDGMEA